ncbi:MAG: zinc-ribbon domain-containing protein [Deltaproteobacteria bacterium]|nr:zinc-ribbon domain-containing protein [Deltaproteobacteria bacterium]
MKFSCEACAARYYMDDDKVRHKTLRIRCKKCGNVMIVGDGETTLSEQGSGPDLATVAPREQLQFTADSVWFYAAAGQTYGPYAEGELFRRFETGRIAEEVHVWKQGFDAWLPAGEVEAFATAIQEARPGRQLTQAIDIGSLNLAPAAPARTTPAATPPGGDAEAKARLTALRDGLRKSRGAESGTSIKAQTQGPTSSSSAEADAGFEVSDLLDGSIADATASLLAKAQALATPLPSASSPAVAAGAIPAEVAEMAPAQDAAPAAAVAAAPAPASAPTPSGLSSIPRLPVLADAALLPRGQGPAGGAMASALGGAPTASLMLQIEHTKSANRTRMLFGGGVVALVVGGAIFGLGSRADKPAVAPTAAVRNTIEPGLTLTPEQAALKADRTDNALSSAKDQMRSALREGASSAVTAIMKKRMTEDAARKKRGMAAVQRTTKVVFNEATGSIAEADINAPEQPPVASAASRARGIGVAIAAPKLGRVSSPAALPAGYFAAGLRKVEESIQYCNQRQLSAEGRLRKPRVELKFSIMPSGRVSTVDFNNDVAATTFAGCMRGRKDRWLFAPFEGEPLQIAKTYIVE